MASDVVLGPAGRRASGPSLNPARRSGVGQEEGKEPDHRPEGEDTDHHAERARQRARQDLANDLEQEGDGGEEGAEHVVPGRHVRLGRAPAGAVPVPARPVRAHDHGGSLGTALICVLAHAELLYARTRPRRKRWARYAEASSDSPASSSSSAQVSGSHSTAAGRPLRVRRSGWPPLTASRSSRLTMPSASAAGSSATAGAVHAASPERTRDPQPTASSPPLVALTLSLPTFTVPLALVLQRFHLSRLPPACSLFRPVT